MAVSSIAVPPDARRDARAAQLVDQVSSWPHFTLKQPWGSFSAGTVLRRAPSSRDPKIRYRCNAVVCECVDYLRGNVCKHIRAIVLWEARRALPAPTFPKLLRTYDELFPACKGGCGDVADTRDGFCDRCASDLEYRQRLAERQSRAQ